MLKQIKVIWEMFKKFFPLIAILYASQLAGCAATSVAYVPENAKNLPTNKTAQLRIDNSYKDMTINGQTITTLLGVVLAPGEYTVKSKLFDRNSKQWQAVVASMRKKGFKQVGTSAKFSNCIKFVNPDITQHCTTYRVPSYRDYMWTEISTDIEAIAGRVYYLSNFLSHFGPSGLYFASRDGDLSQVRKLLDDGKNVDSHYQDGDTALIVAAINGQVQIAKILLSKGANTELQNKHGVTALYLASYYGHAQIVKALLAKGAKTNLQDKDYGSTALMFASAHGNTPIVKALLANGANIDLQTNNGESALFLASRYGHLDVVTTLLAHDARVDQQNKDGTTALMVAAKNGYAEIVKALLTKGASTAVRDKSGKNALQYTNNQEIEKLLNAEN